MKKYLNLGMLIIIGILISVLCVLFGKYLNSSAQKNQFLTTEKIAFVNMDEGIEVDSSTKNYGNEFIIDLGDNFEVTGLEQARTGLENGLYAAYVIIPANFSKNIESINQEPIKSSIVYKINTNLQNDTRENVIADIVSFNNDLSTNIEYVFLDALLEEVHAVQDKTGSILENDIKDLKNILEFAECELVVDPEYPEEQEVNSNIQAVDLTEEYSVIQGIFQKLLDSYKADEKNAQEAYNAMANAKDGIDIEINEMNTELHALAAEEENNQYIDSAEELKNFISSYNNDLAVWKEKNDIQIKENFEKYIVSCEESVNAQLAEKSNEHKEYLKTYYTDALTKRSEDEVSFDYSHAEVQNYLDISELASYHYLEQVGSESITYKNKYSDLSSNIQSLAKKVQKDPYTYEVEKDGETAQETGYLMTAADIEQLLKWVNELEKVDTSTDLDALKNQMKTNIQEDISQIKKLTERQKNIIFAEEQISLFYKDLVHYGAENEECAKEYIVEKQYTTLDSKAIEEVIDYFYSPNLELVVKGEVPEEDEIENMTEEVSESEKILFQNTSETPLLDEKQLNHNIIDYILKPAQYNIIASYTNMKNQWENLRNGLEEFHIEDYTDYSTKQELEQSFQSNANSIQETVGTKEKEYMDYVSQVEETSNANLTAWQESIIEANKQTKSNIEKNLSVIRKSKEEINETNTTWLTDITNALPYTRLGELENKEVYSFIVNPVKYENVSADKKTTVKEETKEKNNNYLILGSMVILIILSGSYLIFRIVGRKHGNNIQN